VKLLIEINFGHGLRTKAPPLHSARESLTEAPRLLHQDHCLWDTVRNNVKSVTFSLRQGFGMEKEQSQHQDTPPGSKVALPEPLLEENAPDPDEDDLDDLDGEGLAYSCRSFR